MRMMNICCISFESTYQLHCQMASSNAINSMVNRSPNSQTQKIIPNDETIVSNGCNTTDIGKLSSDLKPKAQRQKIRESLVQFLMRIAICDILNYLRHKHQQRSANVQQNVQKQDQNRVLGRSIEFADESKNKWKKFTPNGTSKPRFFPLNSLTFEYNWMVLIKRDFDFLWFFSIHSDKSLMISLMNEMISQHSLIIWHIIGTRRRPKLKIDRHSMSQTIM